MHLEFYQRFVGPPRLAGRARVRPKFGRPVNLGCIQVARVNDGRVPGVSKRQLGSSDRIAQQDVGTRSQAPIARKALHDGDQDGGHIVHGRPLQGLRQRHIVERGSKVVDRADHRRPSGPVPKLPLTRRIDEHLRGHHIRGRLCQAQLTGDQVGRHAQQRGQPPAGPVGNAATALIRVREDSVARVRVDVVESDVGGHHIGVVGQGRVHHGVVAAESRVPHPKGTVAAVPVRRLHAEGDLHRRVDVVVADVHGNTSSAN